MKKILLFLCIGLLFLGCDDETQPSGGGQARIIINAPIPAQGEQFSANTTGGLLNSPGSTDLFSVTKGQNITCLLTYQTISSFGYFIELKEVKEKGFHINFRNKLGKG